MLPYVVETGEGGGPPSHLTVLKLAMLALPVSPTPNGDIHHGPLYRAFSSLASFNP